MDTNKQELIDKIKQTMQVVQNAKNSCSHAGLSETVDFFSKNKWVSAYSTLQNQNMKNHLRDMEKALSNLKIDLQQIKYLQPIHAPNDLIDLGVDYFFDLNTDWLSLFNIGSTYRIETKCNEIYQKLDNILKKLEK